jgi:acetyl esterase/lipase
VVRLTDTSTTRFDWLNGDVRTLREDYARVRAKPVPPDALSLLISAVDVLRFPAQGAEDAAIVYFHGGGFIVGSPVTHADIAARLAHHTGLPVYSVDYRLAPDHRAPAPMEDGIAVIRHLIETCAERLVLCGDSAGGAIALATEARLSDDLRPHVAAVASFYGAHGLLDTASMLARGNRADGTDAACIARYFDLAGRDAYAIATIARPSPVPVYLVAAEDDALRDDTLVLARAMEGQGRTVTVDHVCGVDHGFLHGGEENAAAEAALARFAAWSQSQM